MREAEANSQARLSRFFCSRCLALLLLLLLLPPRPGSRFLAAFYLESKVCLASPSISSEYLANPISVIQRKLSVAAATCINSTHWTRHRTVIDRSIERIESSSLAVANSKLNVARFPHRAGCRQSRDARENARRQERPEAEGAGRVASSFRPNVKGAVCSSDAAVMSTNIYLIGCSPPAGERCRCLVRERSRWCAEESLPDHASAFSRRTDERVERPKDSLLCTDALSRSRWPRRRSAV